MYELPHELPNDLRLIKSYNLGKTQDLRKLGNFKKIPEILGLDARF